MDDAGQASGRTVAGRDASCPAGGDAFAWMAARRVACGRGTTGRARARRDGSATGAEGRSPSGPAATRCAAVCGAVRPGTGSLRAAGRAEAVSGVPLRLAYADPPYPANAWMYRGHPDYAGEVDHAALIKRLADYDGWALSTSAEALPEVLALWPPGVRVAAWHRGERPARSHCPLSAWEPVIYCGGRQLLRGTGSRRADSITCGVSVVTTLPGRVIGAKPAAVCRWIFDLLGAGPGDTLDDLFPGTGAVGRAWTAFTGSGDPSRPARADAPA